MANSKGKKQNGLYSIGELSWVYSREAKKSFLSGHFGDIPIVGFVGKKEETQYSIFLSIDVDRLNWLQANQRKPRKAIWRRPSLGQSSQESIAQEVLA